MNAELTIIIPFHNRSELASATLDSIARQTLRPLRVILVDNNSTDNIPSLLLRWKTLTESPEFRIDILSETIPGACAARNRGLVEVTSEYTMFFDSDDIMAPDHAMRALQAFKNGKNPDIVGWNTACMNPDGSRTVRPFWSHSPMWHTIMHGSMATLRYAARTDLFRRAGGWNNNVRGWNDIELGVRMLLLKPNIIKLNGTPTVTIINQPDSITGTSFSSGTTKWESSLSHIAKSLEDNRRYRRYPRLRGAILAGLYRREQADDDARRLLSATMSAERNPIYRLIYRFAYTYTARGYRGAARILRPFFP